MRPTRWTDIFAVTLAAAGVSWAVLQSLYDNLPAVPRTALISVFIVAGTGLSVLSSVSARLKGAPGAKPITPLQLARVAPVAKALSVAGCVVIGVWLGLLITVASDLGIAAHRTDAITALVALLPSIGMLVAGLAIEGLCRASPLDETPPDEDSTHSH